MNNIEFAQKFTIRLMSAVLRVMTASVAAGLPIAINPKESDKDNCYLMIRSDEEEVVEKSKALIKSTLSDYPFTDVKELHITLNSKGKSSPSKQVSESNDNKKPSVEDRILAIQQTESVEDLELILKGESAKTVIQAGEEKRAELTKELN